MDYPPSAITIDWINTIWSTNLEANSKLIACNLRRYMNAKNDMAWPSVARISKECHLSHNCVRKHLKILCREGWLKQLEKSNRDTYKYQAQYPRGILPPPATVAPPATVEPPQSLVAPPAMVAAELNKRTKQVPIAKKKPRNKVFKPPTPEEVREYNAEIDADRFCDFYESKDWLIGKSKMKDWRAAVRNWRRSDEKNNRGQAGRAIHPGRLSAVERGRHARRAAKEREQQDLDKSPYLGAVVRSD